MSGDDYDYGIRCPDGTVWPDLPENVDHATDNICGDLDCTGCEPVSPAAEVGLGVVVLLALIAVSWALLWLVASWSGVEGSGFSIRTEHADCGEPCDLPSCLDGHTDLPMGPPA